MKPTKRKSISAAMAAAVAVFALAGVTVPANATGIPVFDGANLTQTIVSAIENVAQTLKQIQQYQTQLQQYENMLQNTTAPSQQIWDDANRTMNQLRRSIDTLNSYKSSLGGIDAYLGKFKDTAAYRSSPCYSTSGCSPEEWKSMVDSERFGSASQKKANDALFHGLDLQQDAIQHDATQLERLQSAASNSTGHLEAIGYANQLASHQANQLLQIRALLIAQQNLVATRNQATVDREAKASAAALQLREGKFKPSAATEW